MTILHKNALVGYHSFPRLYLTHATIVNGFKCHVKNNKMPVNRLLFVFNNKYKQSTIKDLKNKKLISMESDCLFFIPCNYLIDIDITPDLSFISLQFNLELFYGFDVFENYPECKKIKDLKLITKIRAIMNETTSLATLYRINETIFHLCASWSQLDNAAINQNFVKSHKYKDILNFIRLSCDATTTVEMLADMLAMRRDVFSKKFHKDMGITPKNFISSILF